MTRSCAVPTPEQRQYMEIREAAERAMLDKVYKAIEDAAPKWRTNSGRPDWNSSQPARTISRLPPSRSFSCASAAAIPTL